MEDYRVNLDIYNGPLDLLLYLIRREEVDIHDIPIARITEQYVHYVSLLKQLDPNLAGEFLVMAATLMELKTRMLLPAHPADGQGAEDIGLDPRAELVRQLMEYKAFKDAAGDLREAYTLQSQRFARQQPPDHAHQGEVDLEDVQVWDLLDAFSNLLRAVGAEARPHEVIYDDTPLELHAADIADRLGREGQMTFDMIFHGRTERSEIIGLFLALLELIRRKEVLVGQDHNFGQIRVWLNPNPPEGGADQGSPEQNESVAGSQVASEVAGEGEYISENTSVDGSDEQPRGDDPTTRP
jgi:segregation and condensation protein A